MKRLDQVASLLKSESTLVLATANADGELRATPLFYVADDELHLYWFSSATSVHSKNLKHGAMVAASVHHSTTEWKSIRGLQMRGTVSLVRDRVLRKQITTAYIARFHLGTLFRAAITSSRLYCFSPRWIRYIDNTTRFGYKFEIEL